MRRELPEEERNLDDKKITLNREWNEMNIRPGDIVHKQAFEITDMQERTACAIKIQVLIQKNDLLKDEKNMAILRTTTTKDKIQLDAQVGDKRSFNTIGHEQPENNEEDQSDKRPRVLSCKEVYIDPKQ